MTTVGADSEDAKKQQQQEDQQDEEGEHDAEEMEEYKQLAENLKDQGNAAFQQGNVHLAIRHFSEAIDLDPDNHIYYSNRAAAYMKADSKSKALHDAQKCVDLAPQWPKGYSRLGAAQQSLRRFDAAIDSFKKGIELDPNNKTLWAALRACKDAHEVDKQKRFKEAALERAAEEARIKHREELKEKVRRDKEKAEAAEREERELNDFFSEVKQPEPAATDTAADGGAHDDALADFFNEVTASTEEAKQRLQSQRSAMYEQTSSSSSGEGATVSAEEEKQSLSTEKYTKQDLGTGEELVAKLMGPHYQWKNLNPYHVFQLDIDATDEDIKFRYKKLSLKVHPDRLRNVENAREAFEQVKEAYQKLTDEDQRRTIVLHIQNVQDEYRRERRRLISKGIKENDLPPYEEELSKRVMKQFAEMEQMRRRSEANRRMYNARDKMAEAEEEKEQQRKEEFDKNWSEDNRRDKRIGNWRDFQNDPSAKRTKAASYKEEVREEKKFGVVNLESWKKSWK